MLNLSEVLSNPVVNIQQLDQIAEDIIDSPPPLFQLFQAAKEHFIQESAEAKELSDQTHVQQLISSAKQVWYCEDKPQYINPRQYSDLTSATDDFEATSDPFDAMTLTAASVPYSTYLHQLQEPQANIPTTLKNKIIVLSNQKEQSSIIFGDIHGSGEELAYALNNANFFNSPNIQYIFTGDFTDRGEDNLYVITVLLILKLKYPNVTLLQGNHEYEFDAEHPIEQIGLGLHNAINSLNLGKKDKSKLKQLLAEIFQHLPLATILPTTNKSGALILHGAPSFTSEQLQKPAKHTFFSRNKTSRPHIKDIISSRANVVWNDFIDVSSDQDKEGHDAGRGANSILIGTQAIRHAKHMGFNGIFAGHAHINGSLEIYNSQEVSVNQICSTSTTINITSQQLSEQEAIIRMLLGACYVTITNGEIDYKPCLTEADKKETSEDDDPDKTANTDDLTAAASSQVAPR